MSPIYRAHFFCLKFETVQKKGAHYELLSVIMLVVDLSYKFNRFSIVG